jgi:hypothetical protein
MWAEKIFTLETNLICFSDVIILSGCILYEVSVGWVVVDDWLCEDVIEYLDLFSCVVYALLI